MVECTGLENQQGFVALRGFESHPLRQYLKSPLMGLFRYWKRVWEFESCSTKWRSHFGRTQCARRVSRRRRRINPTCRKRPHHGAFLFFSPSVVEDENPVRPTPQRSCQLTGSSRSERINPTCRKRPHHGAFLFFSPSVIEDENPVRQNGTAILDARSAPAG